MELFGVLAEVDNTGGPLSYMLFPKKADRVGQKPKIIELWLRALRDRFNLHPAFVHTDKDACEARAVWRVWPTAAHHLCMRHASEAF
jgi:hypothetical protein